MIDLEIPADVTETHTWASARRALHNRTTTAATTGS
jgi:hypothetical protein